jgi:glycosyltransferase involved in cell wall biosynthesis
MWWSLTYWRYRKGDQHVPVPSLPGVDPARLIVFNHDVSGHISAPCALVVVYSQTAACGQIAEAPVKVLPGGIGLAGLGQVSRSRRWDQVGSLGRLSTLHDGKIAPQTIEWWPDAPVSRLVVGGQGSQFDALCEAYAATRIEFVGEVRPRSRSEFLAQLDIFCYQTEWHEESFGYVVLEALAAGCVVVTEPRGALGELVLDDVTGLLVDGSDEAAEQVTRLVADPMRCARLSAAGSRSARRYTKRAMQSSFHNMVAAVLSDGRLRDPRQ